MATVYRPCYCTREEVRRALDVKQAGYNNQQIDRQILAGADSVEQLCHRVFYMNDATMKYDWPNYEYTYPWKLYFRDHGGVELAAPPTLIVTGTFLTSPIIIPISSCIFQPVNSGPPFTWMELRRDLSAFFGGGTTPQNDIGVTGTWGYWTKTFPAGTLAAAMLAADTTAQISAGTGALLGVGDTLIIDNERMIVTDSAYITTGVSPTSGGISSPPSAADNTFAVPSGAAFTVGETIVEDSEVMLIQNIIGNNLIVKRAWDGSVLATHSLGVFSARRQISVLRGQLGTTAAGHNNAAPVNIAQIPGLVKELAVAESVVGLTQEPNAYAFDLESRSRVEQNVYGGTGHAQQREPAIGVGVLDLRDRVAARYGIQARSRVV